MKLSEELQHRGFINQISAESLTEILDGDKRTVYQGIDPSADSAHAGNFVMWILLRHLANHGHKVIFLVGGGTGMIGDPKPDAERVLSLPEEVAYRVQKLKTQAQKLLGGDTIQFVNNYDWLSKVNLITFLRDIGKHFTVNELIKKDAIAARLANESGLSYTEFAYPLLQAFDFLTLHREYGCDLQVGGSDQWGNIIAGVDLIRRVEQKKVYAFTVPLFIDKATGKKFGKSEGNAVWLDSEKTSPYAFYQFWLNASDESVIDYLKLFTFIPLSEIEEIATHFKNNPGSRSAQKRLAHEVTTFVHGAVATEAVEKVSSVLFGEGDITSLDEEGKTILLGSAPTCALSESTSITDVLVLAQLATSKREARTFIESGAVTLGSVKVSNPEEMVTVEKGGLLPLRRGKKHFVVLYNK
jgi:tyrosyl-tRNA synthetase